MALKKPINFLVVAHDFCHKMHTDEMEAVAAAFQSADEGLPCRVFLIIREIDLEEEWTQCPDCGRAVHKATGCWWKPCLDSRQRRPNELR